jgi:hypothetical protein
MGHQQLVWATRQSSKRETQSKLAKSALVVFAAGG